MGAYPGFGFEEGFEEGDGLWEAGRAETGGGQDLRSRRVLDEVLRGMGVLMLVVRVIPRRLRVC
ncbi:hypothetical protein BU16DRAFT_598859 [Lophium mytilinum]|uniref:Uncharacterized protein n=1 Tax=Lophium mytilinum TaxID=390894 RepID=A0A6A6RBD8_9PEZI|nr:hypothetical protein BU16DRAFT_598859 [Lophium mytilinum]